MSVSLAEWSPNALGPYTWQGLDASEPRQIFFAAGSSKRKAELFNVCVQESRKLHQVESKGLQILGYLESLPVLSRDYRGDFTNSGLNLASNVESFRQFINNDNRRRFQE